MNVAVDDEDLRHIAIGDHQTSCDGDIVEDGEAGTLVGARVMTAAGRIAGEALGERQAAGEDLTSYEAIYGADEEDEILEDEAEGEGETAEGEGEADEETTPAA